MPTDSTITNAWDSWGEEDEQPRARRSERNQRQQGDWGLLEHHGSPGNPDSCFARSLGRIANTVDGATNTVGYAFWSNGVNQLRYLWDGNMNRTAWITTNPAT